ncbi:MAG TPA: aminotransferase class V-fold PLP-dependent enzyme [Sphingomicrobium sp.]|nr:aminotransferase class V-fold PLP-dependent enzyme [Sphingomicrobium sp.]
MSFKHLFQKSLSGVPGRLHFAAHSHHLWPDASFDGQVECWNDAARLADSKWDKVMGSVWPEAQAYVADELATGDPSAIVFSANTHDFIVRLAAACPRREPSRLRVLASDGEFHSARRQFARWSEDGWLELETVAAEPFDSFTERFLDTARGSDHDLILVSHVLFGSGRLFGAVEDLAGLAREAGPWVVVDGYHAFMAIDCPYARGGGAFYLGGGYKYAMAGEGMGFMHCPPGFGPRPPVTGWFAEFGELTAPPGGVGYRADAMRFMGATFDPSALYRFNAIRRMLAREELNTAAISAHAAGLQRQAIEAFADTALGGAELLNPLDGSPHARFLAFRSPLAAEWQRRLAEQGCVTDVRGDVLRIGFGLYQDEADVAALAELARDL